MATIRKGVSDTMSKREIFDFFHHNITNITAGNVDVTVLLNNAQQTRANEKRKSITLFLFFECVLGLLRVGKNVFVFPDLAN